jgi:vitamin B12 transporter
MKKSRIKPISASLLGLVFSTNTFAAGNIILDDIVVVASRTPQSRESVIGDVTFINRDEIEHAGPSTLVELLQSQPGVEVTSNGGAGALSNVYLRGSGANQIVVLLDGIRVNSVTAGTTYFGNIPLSQIDHIEILRGPASSLYGQDAIGGVIQIFTKRGDGTTNFNASIGYGSYNTKKAEAGLSGGVENLKFSLNVSSYDTDGFSAKRVKSGIQSDNDGYRNLSVNAAISYAVAKDHEVGIQLFNSDGRAKYDSSNSFSNYVDLTQTSIGIFIKNKFTNNWDSTLKISEGIDKNYDYSPSATKIKSIQRQYSWQNDLTLPVGTLTILADRLEQDLASNQNYQNTQRSTNGLFAGYLATINNHSIQTIYRKDDNSQFGIHETGSIGYGYQLNSNWRTTASYGTAFKAPTFNDVFAPPGWGANPNLKPEESKNIEASLRYADNVTNLSLTMYRNEIKNLIAYEYPSMVNINQAEIKGLTITASEVWDSWLLKGNIDIQSPKDSNTDNLLPLRANRHGSLNLTRESGDWRYAAEILGASERYQDPANKFHLAGYAIVNFISNYKINSNWSIQGRLNNLLDKQYTLTTSAWTYGANDPAYNTPGANLFVSLAWLSK